MTDWQQWFDRWEAQQAGLIVNRERRFEVMLDALAVVFEDRPFTIVDLASGPGGISQRVLRRFPNARSVAVDLDPVLQKIGCHTIGDMGGRLIWLEADLRDPDWAQHVKAPVDAVLTATALHWLPAGDLVQLYRQLGEIVSPGGLFINGDNMQYPSRLETIRRITESLSAARREEMRRDSTAEGWEEWWQAVAAEPRLAAAWEERQRRFAWRTVGDWRPGYEIHKSALEEAGFREVDMLLQDLQNRVLIAVR